MRGRKETFLFLSEVFGIGTALLLLPCAVIDLAFGANFVGAVAHAMLLGIACAAILTCLAIHEGWFADYLSRTSSSDAVGARRERREPTL